MPSPWLARLIGRARRPQATPDHRTRWTPSPLRLEALEERLAPAFNLTVDLTATTGVTRTVLAGVATYEATATSANVNWGDIGADLALGLDVVVTSGTGGAEAGNITDLFVGGISLGSANNTLLTFQTGAGANLVGNVSLNDVQLLGTNSSMAVTAANNVTVGTLEGLPPGTPLGSVTISAGGTVNGGTIVATDLAVSAFGGIGTAGTPLATQVSFLEAKTSTGGIFVSNTGDLTLGGATPVLTGVRVTGASGNIEISSTGTLSVNQSGDTVAGPGDIKVSAGGLLLVRENISNTAVVDGKAITLTGDNGVLFANGATVSNTNSKPVTIDVTGSGDLLNPVGVKVDNAILDAGAGAIVVHGTGATGTSSASGVEVLEGSKVRASGAGTVSLTGVGGDGLNGNRGVRIDGAFAVVSTADGAITIVGTGQGSGVGNVGVEITGTAKVQATGAGQVSITGTASPGPDATAAILVDTSGTVLANTGDAVLTGDEIDLAGGTISGNGQLFVQPLTVARGVILGGAANQAGHLILTDADLAALGLTFSQITFGRADGTGPIGTAATVTFGTDVALRTPGASSAGILISHKIDVGSHKLTLTSGSDIATTGAGLLQANALVLTAHTGIHASTAAAAISATNTGSGSILLNETDAVTLTGVTSENGPITVTAGGTITATSVVTSTDDDANAIALTAATGDVLVGAITAGAGVHADVSISAQNGSILDDGADGTVITADSVVLVARAAIGAPGALPDIDTTAKTLTVITTGTGLPGSPVPGIWVTDTDDLTITSATTAEGVILIDAAANLTAALVNAGGSGKNVRLRALGGNMTLGTVTAAGAVVSLIATGAISDGNGAATNVTAAGLMLNAGSGIGAGNAVETVVSTLAFSAGSGGIELANTGALTVGSLTAFGATITGGVGTGAAVVAAASPLTVASNVVMGGAVTLTAGEIADFPACADDLTVNANVTVRSTGSSVALRAGDDLIILAGAVVQAAGAVSLTAGFNDLDMCGGLTLLGTIDAGSDVAICVLDDLTLGTVTAPGFTVSLRSVNGAILDGNGAANNVTAFALAMKAHTGIGTSADPIDTAVSRLEAETATGGVFATNAIALEIGGVSPDVCVGPLSGAVATSSGNIALVGTSLTLEEPVATPNDVTLTATTGSISDSSPGTNRVSATNLSATAVTGVNLETDVATVTAAVTGAGSIQINELNGVTLTGVTTASGPVTVNTGTGDLTLVTVTAGTGGDVTLTAAQGNILDDGVNGTLVSADVVTMIALRAIGAPGATGMIDAKAGTLVAATTGAGFSGAPTPGIWVADVDALTVASAATQDGVILIDAGTSLVAASVSAGGSGRNVRLRALGGDLTVGVVAAVGDVVALSASGAIADGNPGGPDVSAASLALAAGGGIGSGDSLNTAVSTVAWASGSGGVELDNAGALTVGAVAAFGATVTGGTGLGLAKVTAASPLAVANNIVMGGAVTLTAGEISDAPTFADDLTVNANVTVQSTANSVTLQAGDDIMIQAGAMIKAASSVTLTAGFNDLDNHGGVTLLGTIEATGNVAICAIDDLTFGVITAPGFTVSLRSVNGAILDNNGAANNITAFGLALKAHTGIGALADPIDTAVSRLEAETVTGGIFVTNSIDLTVGQVTPDACVGPLTGVKVTGTGDILLTSASVVVDEAIATPNNVTLTATATFLVDAVAGINRVSATNLTVTAVTGVNLETDVATVTASVTSAGSILINELNAITLTSVATANGSITVNAGGDTTAASVVSLTDADANDITLSVASGNLTVVTVTAGAAGDVTLTAAQGSILDDNVNGTLVSADALTMTALRAIGAPGATGMIDTKAGTLVSATAGAGFSGAPTPGVWVTDVDALTVASAATQDGVILIDTATSLNAQFVTGGGSGRNVRLRALGGDLTVGVVTAAGDLVQLIAGGDILDGNATGADVVAASLVMVAGSGIGEGNSLNTAVGTVAWDSGNGSIELDNAGPLTVGTLTAFGLTVLGGGGNGAALVTSSTALIVASDVFMIGSVVLTAGENNDFPACADDLIVTANVKVFSATDVWLRAGDDIAILANALVQSSGPVRIDAGFNDLDTCGGLTLLGTIDAGSDVAICVLDDLTLGTVTAPGFTVSLRSVNGAILDGNGAANNVTAFALAMKAHTGIGTSADPIETSVSRLEAATDFGGIFVRNDIALTIGGVTPDPVCIGSLPGVIVSTSGDVAICTSSGDLLLAEPISDIGFTVSLAALNGAILDADPVNVTASALAMKASTGIGTLADSLDLTVTSVEAETATGGVFLTNTGSLTVGQVTPDACVGPLTGVRVTGGGDIHLFATGLVVIKDIAAGTGDVTLTATFDFIFDILLGSGRVSGDNLTATAVTGITLETDVNSVTASVGAFGSVFLDELNGVTLTSVTTANGPVTVNTATGDLTLVTVTAGAAGDVTLTAAQGSILDDNVNGTLVSADALTMTALRAIGAPGATGMIDTKAGTLVSATTGAGFSGAPTPGIWVTDVDALTVASATTADGVILIDAGTSLVAASVSAGGSGRNVRLRALGGDLTVGVVAAVGDVVALSASGAIADGNAGGADVTAASLALTAGGGIGVGDGLNTAVSTAAWSSGSGGIELDNAGALTVGAVAAFGATVTGGSGTGAAVVTAASPLTVANNVVMGGAVTLTAGEISDAPTFADDLTVNANVTVQSQNGSVTLQAGDDVVIQAGATAQAAGAVRIDAGFGDLDSHGSLALLGTVVAGGDVASRAINNLTLGTVTAPGFTVSLRSVNGAILDNNGAANNVTAANLAMKASTGIGAAADPIETTVSRLEAETATGGIFVVNSIAMNIGGVNPDVWVGPLTGVLVSAGGNVALTGASLVVEEAIATPNKVTLTATTGSLTDSVPNVNRVVGSDLNSTAGTGISLETDVATATASVTGAGDIVLNELNGVTLTSVTTANGSVTVNTPTGDLTVISINAGAAGNVSLKATAGSVLDDENNATRITGNVLTMTAQRAIGQPGLLLQMDTQVNTLIAATTGTPLPGVPVPGIWLADADALTVTSATTLEGVILIDAGTSFNAQLVTAGGVANVRLRALGGDLTLGAVTAAGDVVYLSATGAITDGNAVATNVTAGRLALHAGTGIGAGNALETKVGVVAWRSDSGDVEMVNDGALTIGTVSAFGLTEIGGTGAGAATITATSPLTAANDVVMGGAITLTAGEKSDAPAFADDLTVNAKVTVQSTGGSVALQAGDDVFVLAEAKVKAAGSVTIFAGFNDADGVGAVVLTGSVEAGVNLAVRALGDVTLGAINAANGTVSIRSVNGAILDNNGAAVNVTALALAMKANTGIGTAADPIETAVGRLEAETNTGGIFVANTGNVALGGVAPDAVVGPLSGVKVQTSGDVVLTCTANLAIDTAGDTVAGPNNVSLTAQGVLTASQNITSTSAVAGRAVSLTGHKGVTVDNAATVTNAAGVAITVTIFGVGSDVHPDGVTLNGATLNPNAGSVAVTGSGSTAAGVRATNSIVQAAGTGTVALIGTGTSGVVLDGNTSVTTANGALSVNGTGGASIGVRLAGTAIVRATGTGTVSVTGATANADTTAAIELADTARVQTGTGPMTLTGDEMNFAVGTTVTGTGTLLAQPMSAARGVSIGAAANQAGKLSLTTADLARVSNTFPLITIGRADGQGAISVDGNTTINTDVVVQNPGTNSAGISAAATLSVGINDMRLDTAGTITTTGAGLFVANTLALVAGTGIRSKATPARTQVNNLEATTRTGGIYVQNAGPLTLGGAQFDLGGVTVTISGDIEVTTTSPLTVAETVRSNVDNVTLTAGDSAGTGDNLTVQPNVTISSNGGRLFLRAGDSLTIDATAKLTTAGTGTILLEVDANNADAGTGGVATLVGASLTAPAGATVFGNSDSDTFNLSPSPITPISVLGAGPVTSPGDTLNLNIAGQVGTTLDITDTFSATMAFAAVKDVKVSSIETLNLTPAGNDARFHTRLNMKTAKIDGQPFFNENLNPDAVRVSLNDAATRLVFDAAKDTTNHSLAGYFSLPISFVRSVSLVGSADRTDFSLVETAGGLPSFPENAIGSHKNNGTFTLANVGLNVQGGASGTDSFELNLRTNRALSYFADLTTGKKGGNVEVPGRLLYSFDGLGETRFVGNTDANGTLVVGLTANATLVQGATKFTFGDDGTANNKLSRISGDAVLFSDLVFGGLNNLSLASGAGAQAFEVGGLDTLDTLSSGLQQLTLDGGIDGDSFLVKQLLDGRMLTLLGGAGDDVFNVVPGLITIDGAAGKHELTINGTNVPAAQNVTLNANSAVGGGNYKVTFQAANNNFEKGVVLVTGAAADTVNVAVNARFINPTTVVTGGGNDKVNVAGAGIALRNTLPNLVIETGEGANSLTVNDNANTTPELYDVNVNRVSGTGWAVNYFATGGTTDLLTVIGGRGNDTVRFLAQGATNVTVNASLGNDTLRVFVGPNSLPTTGLIMDGGAGTNTLQTIPQVAGALARAFPRATGNSLMQVSYVANTPIPYYYRNATAVGINADANFITALYRHILGRNPNPAEVTNYLSLLVNQGRAAVAHSLENSAEGRSFLVRAWYLQFFGRTPTLAESLPLVAQLLRGDSEEAVLAVMLAAPLLPNTTPFRERMVITYYRDLLRRDPSPFELRSAADSGYSLQALREQIETSGAFYLYGV